MNTVISHFSEDNCFSLVVWIFILFCHFLPTLGSVYSVTLFFLFILSLFHVSFPQMIVSCLLIFKCETKKSTENPKCVDWA